MEKPEGLFGQAYISHAPPTQIISKGTSGLWWDTLQKMYSSELRIYTFPLFFTALCKDIAGSPPILTSHFPQSIIHSWS